MEVSPCIGGQHQACIGVAAFMGGQGAKAGSIGYSEDVAPTLKNAASGTNTVPDCVYALQGNGIDRSDTASCNGCGWRENECYTLNTIDRPAVVYDCRGNGDGKTAANLTVDHENRVTDYTNVVCAGNGQMDNITMKPVANTLDNMHDQQIIIRKIERKYIVRRLTPLECCRLQGFPGCWTDGVEGSDSAKYKMWGNGMALPNMLHVMRGIAREKQYG